MKKTFTTTMPDQVGAFLRADECICRLGLNITRVSYNKAVDTHMLFLEVEGEEPLLQKAEQELAEIGYLQSEGPGGSVVLLEFMMKDEPGTLTPILRLIDRFHFNISYISSRENGTGYQSFKMGLFIEDGRALSEFLYQAAPICPVRVVDYDRSEKLLDNTVFYLHFADELAEKLGLSAGEKRELIVCSNQVMQTLDERDGPVYKTFDYIRRIAVFLKKYRGKHFAPRISHDVTPSGIPMVLIEPPCGSNLCLFDLGKTLLCFDSGFACYREETRAVLEELFPDFEEREKVLCLTHADVDHCGGADLFDRVLVNRKCYESFQRERAGAPAIREENPLHAPYVRISKLLSRYRPPKLDKMEIIGDGGEGDALLQPIGSFTVGPLCFEAYEGRGGHAKGEQVLIERRERIVFTGDIFVHIKGFSKEQAAYNRLAPYLMTSVDTEPARAKAEREAIFDLLEPGDWKIIGGHGAMLEYNK